MKNLPTVTPSTESNQTGPGKANRWRVWLGLEARVALILGSLGLAIAFHLPTRLWQSMVALFSFQLDQANLIATPLDGLGAPFAAFGLLSLLVWLQGAVTLGWLAKTLPDVAPMAGLVAGWQKWAVGVGLFGAVGVGLAERVSLFLGSSGRLPAPDYDEMVYFSGASLVAQGQLPYRDFFLAHPPLADFFYGLVLRLTGLKSGGYDGLLAVRWSEIGLGLLTGLALFWVGSRLWVGSGWAWLSGLLAAWLYLLDARAADIATLETPANFFGIVGLGCGLEAARRKGDGRWLWGGAGAALLLSGLCKLPGLAILGAVVVWLLVEKRWKALGWLSVGAIAALIVVVGGLGLAGVRPGEMLRQVIFFQVLRPAEGHGKDQIGRLADDAQSGLTFALAALSLLVLSLRMIVKRPSVIAAGWLLPILISLPLVAIFSLGKSFHPWYYVQWTPALALLAGGLFAPGLWRGFDMGWLRRRQINWLLAGLGLALALPMTLTEWRTSQQVEYDRVYRQAATLIPVGQTGLVFDPGYSFMAGRTPVRLTSDNKFLVDSAGYMTYLNLDLDRLGWGQLLKGTTDQSASQVFALDRGQALMIEGMSRAGWAVLDGKLALAQLTPRSVEYVATAATKTGAAGYADIYLARPWDGRHAYQFANGLIMTPLGLSSSKGGQANFDPIATGEILRLKQAEVGTRTLDLRLVWRVAHTPAQSAKVFVHLVDEKGATVAQRDVLPLDDRADIRRWQPGDAYEDVHSLPLPANLPPGRYRVEVGLYDMKSGQAIGVGGQGSINLGYVEVG